LRQGEIRGLTVIKPMVALISNIEIYNMIRYYHSAV